MEAKIFDEGVIINGVKWATCNVDKPGTFAANPEDAGMFYQWNRKIGWSATEPMINSNGGTDWDDTTISEGSKWEKANDPSPEGWRVPAIEELRALLDAGKVNQEWAIENGINGRRFTDKITGNSIFLPAIGFRDDYGYGTLYHAGLCGDYWSGTQSHSTSAYYMYFGSGYVYEYYRLCRYGFSVRSVAE